MKGYLILFLVLLAGCATDNRLMSLTPAEKEAISRLTIYKKNPAAQFRFFGVVKDHGCNYNEAMTGMKLEAVKLKANSVVDYRCRQLAKPPLGGCSPAYECSGSAISIK